MSPPGTAFRVGTVVDSQYEVRGVLGSGGMGIVLLAQDLVLDRRVALKLIRPELVSNSNTVRFLAEARAMAQINHPNVVGIYAFGQHSGAPYIAMEYIDGNTVEDLLGTNAETLAIDHALGIMKDTCTGIHAIHEARIVHGDIKPSNLLLTPHARVAIADLGLAKLFADTMTGIAGTPAYIPPERLLGEAVPEELKHTADIYALGVLGYQLLTGEHPFDPALGIKGCIEGNPRSASDLKADIGKWFDAPLKRAVARHPADRTSSALELFKSLTLARTALANRRGTRRFLVVDDDPDFLLLAKTALENSFTQMVIVDTVEDGVAAIEAIQKEEYALVISDLSMPGMNGIEVTASIRSFKPNMPILIATGTGSAADWKVLQAMGATAFVVKPIDPTSLGSLVRQLLRASGTWKRHD